MKYIVKYWINEVNLSWITASSIKELKKALKLIDSRGNFKLHTIEEEE